MKKLRVASIGCGGIANFVHKDGWLTAENAEIVATCDIVRERAVEYAKAFGLDESDAYTDYKEVLKRDDVDAVDICTPNYLHSIIAIDALNAGKHVLTEKPDAMTPELAEDMKAAAEANGKVLMAIRNNRFSNGSKYVKKLIENGELGEIYMARCGWQRRRGIPGKGGWFTTKSLSGGGPLIDLGVHMIDLTMYFMGNPAPATVSGNIYTKFAGGDDVSDSEHSQFGDKTEGEGTFDVEDLATGFVRFKNGACMQLEFSWASNIDKEKTYVELRGDKAGIYWYPDGTVKLFGEKHGSTYDEEPHIWMRDWGENHGENIHHFVDVVLNGAEPNFVPQQGIDVLKVIAGIYRSAEQGAEIKFD